MRVLGFALCMCLLLALLPSCSTINAILAPNPNVVSTLEASLAAAEDLATPYVKLDSCQHLGHGTPCRDPSITKNIEKARLAAYTAVTKAEANETASTVQAAQNAVDAYKAIAESLQ